MCAYHILVEHIVMKYLINMTKKDLLEVIEDIPMDAEVCIWEVDHWGCPYEISPVTRVEYNILHNRIELC